MALSKLYIDPKKDKAERFETNRLLKKSMAIDDTAAIDVIKRAAQRTGMSPAFLAANAMQEGMNLAINDSNEYSIDDEYPVNGYVYYGLDTFGDAADTLKKKGYLPKGFDFLPFDTKNERGQRIGSAAFKSNEDALVAKAAYLKDFQDQVQEYANKKGLKLDTETKEYLTMSAYNGGMGNAKIMVDELASGKYDPKEYISKGLTSRKGVHKNIEPRLKKMKWIYDDFLNIPKGPSPAPVFPSGTNIMSAIYGKGN